jgi:hypothetical protein
LWGVICLVAVGGAAAQIAKRTAKSSGPRALGLVEILANGKARIAAICIMVDGKFYDAGTYKATPVPMSVDPETVYEGTRNGISTGLYTVSDAHKVRGSWFGEGKWVPAGSEPRKAPAITSTKRVDEEEAPPILRRADSPSAKAADTKPAEAKQGDAKPPEPTGADAPPRLKKGDSKETAAPVLTTPAAPGAGERPILRRSKPGDVPQKFEEKDFSATAQVKERFLAISDAGGPDTRPYVLMAKPDEVLAYRKKLQEIASETVRALYGAKTDVKTAGTRAGRAKARPGIAFQNVQMQTLDLTSSNDPVLVFTAAVDPAEEILGGATKATVTVVARVDIYGDLRKLLAEATDEHHLDVYPRLEFLDAVDADGDSNGELVFRETSDGGTGFVVYRAGLDRVWSLFDSLRNY